MPVTLFSKSIEELDAGDVDSLLGWPETLTVEFKKQLSMKGGGVHPWTTGGTVDEHARDKLFKEVIALANTSGGHLILGIDETTSAPATAASVVPVPRCVELAERLERAAQQIDPPIPLLLVRGIETAADAGVIVFRVPASRSAPHRGLDKECYVRRGTSSVPVSMREIQDMTLAVGRRGESLDRRFGQGLSSFVAWLDRPTNTDDPRRCGFHVGAYPANVLIDLGRIDTADLPVPKQGFKGKFASADLNIYALNTPLQPRPIIRGAKFLDDPHQESVYMSVHADGFVDLGFRVGEHNDLMPICLDWIIGHTCNVLRAVDWLRRRSGQADAEYALELHIYMNGSRREPVSLRHFGARAAQIGHITANKPVCLPRLSIGPNKETDKLLNYLLGDLFNAAEKPAPPPDSLTVDVFS